VSDGQLMISGNDNYADAVDDEESVVDIIDFFEIIYTAELKLECMIAPESHESNLC
jgi:hypothetical protein